MGGEEDAAHRAGSAAALAGSFVLDLRLRDINAVRDAVFLHGYAEPVLLVLHEVAPTWAGRLALRHDTCALAAFSLSLAQKRATRIWGDASLPYDCSRLVAVPGPLGGALIMGTSFLLYRAQGAPPVSLALYPESMGTPDVPSNELSEDGRPLAPPSGKASVNPAPAVAAHATVSALHAELDRAAVAWAAAASGAPVGLVSTKTGAMLALHMHMAGRNLSRMELRAVAAPPCTPSAMVLLGPGSLFVGSRMGDSLLLEYAYTPPPQAAPLALEAPPPSKRARTDSAAAAPPAADDEDAMLYGGAADEYAPPPPARTADDAPSAPVAGAGVAPGGTFAVAQRDALPSLAPAVAFAVGETAVAGEPDPERGTRQELLLAVGQGVHGALVALHRGVAPDLVAAVPLPGVRGAWALHARKAGAAPPSAAQFHDYLLLSTRDATMVLDASSSDELQEVTDRVEFECAAPTIAAGTLFGGARIAQVHPAGIRVCAGAVKAQDVPLSALLPAPAAGVTVAAADVCHPFVLLHLSDGSLRLLSGNPATNRLEPLPPRASGRGLARTGFTAVTLYDDSGDGALAAGIGAAAVASSTHFVVTAHESGPLEIYGLPSGSRVFAADKVALGPQLLCGSPAAAAAAGGVDVLPASSAPPPPPVVDVRLDTFPGAGHDALLLTIARGDGEVFAYRGFKAPTLAVAPAVGRAPTELRFVRYALEWTPSPGTAVPEASPGGVVPRRLVRCAGVRGAAPVSGIFVLGTSPHWLLVSRGRVQAHPVSARGGGITAVTSFHNVNCQHGLICATSGADGALRICSLPPSVDYSGAWPAHRSPLGCSPVAAVYAPEARCYAVVVAARRPFRPRVVEEGDMHAATVTAVLESRAAREGGTEEAHEVRLVTPGSLQCSWTLELEPGESVLAMCPLQVRNATTGELLPVLALGTGFLGGEDAPCRGRCLLLEVSWRRDSTGAVARTGAIMHARAFKSAVTAISPLEGMHKGYLLMAVGSKLGVHSWNGRELTCIAFYDTPDYSVGLASVKNFILLGDVQKGVFFLRWKDSPTEKLLAQLAKTFERVDFAAGEFLIDGNTLSLLSADTLGMLHVYAFTPGAVEAWMGQKLLPRGRFHSGRTITQALRLRTADVAAGGPVRAGVLLGTLEGALAGVAPVDEGAYAPLRALTDAMQLALPHPAGLNPRGHRAARERAGRAGKQPCPETLLDLPLLGRFLGAPWGVQHELADRVGAPRDALVKAARAAVAGTCWFV